MARFALSVLSLAVAAPGWPVCAEAAPAQRDPWRQPASDRPGWSDAAPTWTDPGGDQAQQGRTWANPRRGAVEQPDASPGIPVGGEAKAPARGERNWDEKHAAPPRQRADDPPQGPPRQRAGEPGERERVPSRPRQSPRQSEDARPRQRDEPSPAPRRRIARIPSVRRPPASFFVTRREVRRGFVEGPGPVPMHYPGGFAGGEAPFLPYRLPPRCPLIIKVGRGLADPVRSEIIGGRRNCL